MRDFDEGPGFGGGGWRMEPVPPPKQAPSYPESEKLGLLPGLRAEKSRHGQWRCAECQRMQPNDSWQVWVPDGVCNRDPGWSITEACRVSAYNGHLSAWCLSCARGLSGWTGEGILTKAVICMGIVAVLVFVFTR